MTASTKKFGAQQPEWELEELLRKALATPPISNEDILKRSKESHGKDHQSK